jgi:hypothetical protein
MTSAVSAWSSILLRIGESDCEEFHDGLFAQPVNASTSFAYSVVGLVVITLGVHWDRWRARTVIYGLCLVATGLGSVLFHGPQPAGSRFLHDFPIVLVILLIALHDLSLLSPRLRRVPQTFLAVGTGAALLAVVWPDSASIVTGIVAVVAVVAEVSVYRRGLRGADVGRQRRLYAAIVGVAGIAAGSWLLGRTDGPLCDPDGGLQFHGLWHAVSAIAFGLWWWLALAEQRPRTGPTLPEPIAETR